MDAQTQAALDNFHVQTARFVFGVRKDLDANKANENIRSIDTGEYDFGVSGDGIAIGKHYTN